jgi:hypothetical protein
MSDDTFDDGLVHSHHWATEKPVTGQPAEQQTHDHDDGLVHEHGWASNGK